MTGLPENGSVGAFVFLADLEECAEAFEMYRVLGYRHPDEESDVCVGSDRSICRVEGHDLRDCSYGGPESGNMDHECVRCGEYWHYPLY